MRVIGREAELARLGAAVARAADSPAVVVVEGQAGIGKTTLLQRVMHDTVSAGIGLITARPTRAETALAFAALGDVMRDLDLSALPARQKVLLEIALGRRDGRGEPPPPSELGAAVVAALGERVRTAGPVVMVIDDLQWMDRASLDVLTFAWRRLPSGVAAILARRTADLAHAGSIDDEQLIEVPEADRMIVLPLDVSSIEKMLLATDGAVPLHVLQRAVTLSGGNPLFALELARDSSPSGRSGPALRMPSTLGAVIGRRFRDLVLPTRIALAAVAVLAEPTIDRLDELDMFEQLAPAEERGIVHVAGRRVEFTHPLLAAAAHDSITSSQRLMLRRRLADVTEGTERSIHLALGATRPDAAIAAELATASRSELGRGAAVEAAELAVLALAAAPSADVTRPELGLLAVEALFRAGRTEEAVHTAHEVLGTATTSTVRCKALLALATIEYSRSDNAEAGAELARLVLDGTDDPDLLAEAHTILSRAMYTDFVAGAEHADAALAIIRRRPDSGHLALASALTASAAARFYAGQGLDRAAFEQAIELERDGTGPVADSAFASLAAHLKYADELDESQAMLEALAERADPGSLPYALSHLPQLHLWAGRWHEAEQCANRHLALAEQTRQESQIQTARFNLAVIAAHRGDIDAASPLAQGIFEDGRREGVPWTERSGAALVGFLAMSTGDAEAAAKAFSRYDELGEQIRLYEPGYFRFHGDYVEALVAVGAIERATEAIERVQRRLAAPQIGPRPAAASSVLRGRALVAAHGGDRDCAFDAAQRAVDMLSATPLRYDHARALLTVGIIARRFKERASARDALAEALVLFEQMGAESLAERTRRELDRVGGRPGGRTSTLTATEAGVAELAAAGRTTRQIADALFISVKTVEANLTRVYRKLGLTNRAQLATFFASNA